MPLEAPVTTARGLVVSMLSEVPGAAASQPRDRKADALAARRPFAGKAAGVPIPVLPDGPRSGRLVQTVGLHRDPLAWLRRRQGHFGDVFTIRLLTTGPVVVVADAVLAQDLPAADPALAHA